MAGRPDAIGLTVEIESLDDADAALYELGWLLAEKARIEAKCKQEIEAIKQKYSNLAVVEVGGKSMPIADRIVMLETPLTEWTEEHIREYLAGKKAKVLQHGELGLRQQPRVVELGLDEDGKTPYTAEQVLQWIRESTELKNSLKKELLSVSVALHLKGAKELYESGKISLESLTAIGLAVREPYDLAVVKPAKIAVSTE